MSRKVHGSKVKSLIAKLKFIVVFVGFFGTGVEDSWSAELLEYERNTIDVYEKTKESAVYIECRRSLKGHSSTSAVAIPGSSGSGVVWDKTGHIVTNYHVIRDADSILVIFENEKEFKAELIGSDSTKDLAVLKVDAPINLLKPVSQGEEEDLVVGRKVLALGSPFGLQRSLTVGVISAIGRQIRSLESRTIKDIIQTDAVINPGNSGGPLLDSRARLIGINTAIITNSGANTGIGFAIPIHIVKRVVPELIQYGTVRRAGLGIITLRDKASGLQDEQGVVILKVPSGSPGESAGLKGISKDSQGKTVFGDIIIKINDAVIHNNDDLANFLEECAVGDVVKMTVKRGSQEYSVSYTLVQIK